MRTNQDDWLLNSDDNLKLHRVLKESSAIFNITDFCFFFVLRTFIFTFMLMVMEAVYVSGSNFLSGPAKYQANKAGKQI